MTTECLPVWCVEHVHDEDHLSVRVSVWPVEPEHTRWGAGEVDAHLVTTCRSHTRTRTHTFHQTCSVLPQRRLSSPVRMKYAGACMGWALWVFRAAWYAYRDTRH